MGKQVLRFSTLTKTSLFCLTVVCLAVAWHLIQSELSSAQTVEISQSVDDATVALEPAAHYARAQPHDTPPASQPQKRSSQRSFSFHYLDILEWLFASKRDAPNSVPHRPSASTLSS